jgi:hypothetical protein
VTRIGRRLTQLTTGGKLDAGTAVLDWNLLSHADDARRHECYPVSVSYLVLLVTDVHGICGVDLGLERMQSLKKEFPLNPPTTIISPRPAARTVAPRAAHRLAVAIPVWLMPFVTYTYTLFYAHIHAITAGRVCRSQPTGLCAVNPNNGLSGLIFEPLLWSLLLDLGVAIFMVVVVMACKTSDWISTGKWPKEWIGGG